MATTRCNKCGHVYELEEKYEVDTWNIGHYGCTMSNAPRIFTGYRDPGCPKCIIAECKAAREEDHLPFDITVPEAITVTIGERKTTRIMGNGKLIVTQEQPIDFNINFNCVDTYVPITYAQERAIESIEWNTKYRFTGKSKEDAQEFIQEHIAESMENARKRRSNNTTNYRRSFDNTITDEDCDLFGLDPEMFT